MGLVGYASVADRVWELRRTVTAYDACYVALAELLDAPLATLDVRLARAPGLRCQVITPAA
jgi:predicted nucleic acid-binding protein